MPYHFSHRLYRIVCAHLVHITPLCTACTAFSCAGIAITHFALFICTACAINHPPISLPPATVPVEKPIPSTPLNSERLQIFWITCTCRYHNASAHTVPTISIQMRTATLLYMPRRLHKSLYRIISVRTVHTSYKTVPLYYTVPGTTVPFQHRFRTYNFRIVPV